MTAISHAESTLNGVECDATATGDKSLAYYQNGRLYGYSVSALQVRILPGREACDTYDLSVNVECAHNIWLGQGYNAWTMYMNNKYKKYL